jgi:hypothetical protein
MTSYPQDNIGKARQAKARQLAMSGSATTLAAKWADGQRDKVRSALASVGSKDGAIALAALISRALHDDGEDWRGFGDWLVENAIAPRAEVEAA